MNCPNCNSKVLIRIRRSLKERMILNSKKYKCMSCYKKHLKILFFGHAVIFK